MIRNRHVLTLTGAASVLLFCLAYMPAQSQDAATDAPAGAKPAKRSGKHAKPELRPSDAAEAPAADKDAAAQAAAATPSPLSRVCLLSRETIVGNAAVNVSINQRLLQLRQSAQNEINEANKTLQADTKALDADKRPPTDEGLKKAREDLANRNRALAQRADLLTRELEATRQTVSVQLKTAALPLLQGVEKQQGCTLLLARESVLDGAGAIDVTPMVIAAMNAELHPQPFGLVTLAEASPK